jgi:hypothetical protein
MHPWARAAVTIPVAGDYTLTWRVKKTNLLYEDWINIDDIWFDAP